MTTYKKCKNKEIIKKYNITYMPALIHDDKYVT